MKTIWKYTLEDTDVQEIEVPMGAQFLTVQTQFDSPIPIERPCIWALVETDAPKVKREIRIYDTGVKIDVQGLKYIGTCQLRNGRLVLHIFERISKRV
ncbi:MAG: hypothetical protein MN733_34550 [Nitrososphaera sp.]|nr:hypothetical protein [Nitrososphaera sp.]